MHLSPLVGEVETTVECQTLQLQEVAAVALETAGDWQDWYLEIINTTRSWMSMLPSLPSLGLTYNILLGIRMRIRCLTQSTWKIRNREARSAGETTPCCPPPIRSWVSERSKSLGWWHASRFSHRYLVIFHPFVEQLTVFHTSVLVLASSSIFWVLDLDLHAIARWHPERHVPKGT